mmetsp:Transcript_9449/g.13973  ORF Transcript_9449/g.13973 Transcript_9449/m.13973 type:complete len:192 (+) Transcript_9449:41-616(+)
MKKDATTMLIIMPKVEDWGEAQKYRKKNIPNLRCGPHITLLHPYVAVEEFDKEEERIKNIVKTYKEINIEATKYDEFKHRGGRRTIIARIKKDKALMSLQQQIIKNTIFEQTRKNKKFEPHISMRNTYSEEQTNKEIKKLINHVPLIKSTTNQILMVAREGKEQYYVKKIIPMGQQMDIKPQINIGQCTTF